MKIKSMELVSVDLKLSEPYSIAYETIEHAVNLFLKIETNKGLFGFGCAAPDLEVTGETAESVRKVFNDWIEPRMHGCDPLRYVYHLERLRSGLQKHPSAMAMLDMALLDLLGKASCMPLFKLLGGFRTCMKTSITIGILPLTETVEKAEMYVKKGFAILKVKGGSDVDLDIERIARIRERIGIKTLIRFDANQGYSFEDSIRFINDTRSYKIELLEQPTPKKEWEVLGHVTRESHLPIMADESIMNLVDAFKLAKNDLVDTVNIKIQKVGGINEALHINSVSKAANFEVMVGCLDESALGISAGLHFALARPNVHYADLDGHFDIIDDPFAGSVILKKGTLYPNNLPGLGVVNTLF